MYDGNEPKQKWWDVTATGGDYDAELTDDGHEGVKVADVEALSRHVNEELHDSSSVLLLPRLLTKWRTLA